MRSTPETSLGPNVNIDPADIEDSFVRTMSEWQADSEVVRFDGTDIMPGAVGSGYDLDRDHGLGHRWQHRDFVNNVENSWPAG